MTNHFINEHEVCLESWLSVPYKTIISDNEIILEGWMMVPFDADIPLELEEWMASIGI